MAFLSQLSGGAPIETHISLVFVGADTVWKLKKAVRLPFLDFTRIEDRHRFLSRELELNQRTAPDLYRDVVPLTRSPDGTLTLGGEGPAVDWVLRMAPVPGGDFLDVMAAAGALPDTLLDAVADAVAAFHGGLPPAQGARPPMREIALGNIESARAAGLPDDRVTAWGDAMLTMITATQAWLDQRAAAGFVRRVHGDLHLGNLCLWHGQPVLFDALEFDESMGTIDLGYDLGFLLMDLEHCVKGDTGRAAANRVLNRYVARTGDAALVRGLPIFLSMRAMVLAHVRARRGHAEASLLYLDSALAYLRPCPAMLVAIGGLPGTGKSTLARALAPRLGRAPGALVLRSDEIRKRRAGAAPEDRLPLAAYSTAESTAVFTELGRMTQEALESGHTVIGDATFMNPAHRTIMERAAAAAGVPFTGLWLTAPLTALEARVAARQGDASDATVEVVRAAAADDPGPGSWISIDARESEMALLLATGTLRPHVPPCP